MSENHVKISQYGGIATAGQGLSLIIAAISLTGQTADITDTNFTNANVAGLYRVSYELLDTTADLTAGAVTLNIKYTDNAAARTVSSTPVVLTATTAFAQGVIFVRLNSGNITYGVTHTGIYGTSQYAVYIICERLN